MLTKDPQGRNRCQTPNDTHANKLHAKEERYDPLKTFFSLGCNNFAPMLNTYNTQLRMRTYLIIVPRGF